MTMKISLNIIVSAIILCVIPGYVLAQQNPYYVEVTGGQTFYCGAATGTLVARSTNPGSVVVAHWHEGYIESSTQNFVVTTTHNISRNLSFNLPSASVKSYRAVLNTATGPYPSQHITLISSAPATASTRTGAAS